MYYSEESHTAHFLTGIAVGLLMGAGIAMLSAPQSGRRTRRRIRHRATGAGMKVEGAWEDFGEELRSAIDAGRKKLNL